MLYELYTTYSNNQSVRRKTLIFLLGMLALARMNDDILAVNIWF